MPHDPATDPAGVPGREAPTTTPWLRLAAALVGLEALVLLGLAVAELVSLSADRLVMGATTTLFFVVYGAGLLACAYGLVRAWTWVRSPVVLTQLIALGLAWSFRGGETGKVALALTVVAVAVVVLVVLPSSTAVLVDEGEVDRR